ncbi:hypothetical protein ACRRCN_005391, partial [Escherichia coli]|nr:hypothetical protein [Escherichia coli]EFO2884371.1 hypothetical protein [Escherichia coli]
HDDIIHSFIVLLIENFIRAGVWPEYRKEAPVIVVIFVTLFQYAADIHCILAVAFFPFKRQLRRFCLISDEPLVVSMSL